MCGTSTSVESVAMSAAALRASSRAQFGLAVGLSLSVVVLVWQNYRDKRVAVAASEVPRPEPRHGPRPDPFPSGSQPATICLLLP